MRRRSGSLTLVFVFLFAFITCKKEEAVTDSAATASDTSATATDTVATTRAAPVLADCSAATEKEFTVDIVFTGLVTFLDPTLDIKKPLPGPMSAVGPLTLLIPDVTAGSSVTLPPGTDSVGTPVGKPIHKHVPFISADVQYICKDSTAQIDPSWCSLYAYHQLTKEKIQWDSAFITSGGTANPSLTYSLTTGGECPTNADAKSLYWVPSLSRIGAKGQDLDPKLMDDMTATADLANGTLEACVLSKQKLNFRVNEKDPAGDVTQAIAEEVHYTLKGKGKTFTISLAPMGGGSPTTMSFIPVKSSTDNTERVEIRIGNLPENFIPVTEVTVGGTGTPDNFDSHFGVYHRVLKDKGRDKEIPFDAGNCQNFVKCIRLVNSRPCVSTDRPVMTGFPSTDGANCGPNQIP